MRRSSLAAALLLAVTALVALPGTAHAQSAIAGVVKDSSGAILPGVTVEAASPALIEKSRTVVSDGQGQYKIVDLRPGTYTITFTLSGFQTFKREGLSLPANFTATVNANMSVGAIEEAVTVSGASPVVDVQSNMKSQVLSRDVLDAVPTAHTIQSVGQLVVGVTLSAPDVGGSRAMQQTYFTVHGLGAAQTSVLVDGMIVNGLQGDGAIQSYLNDAMTQESVYQTGGGTVDAPTGGVKINLVPREGGNQIHGSLFEGYESSSLQADNFTDFLTSHGVTSLDKIGKYSDTDFTLGGPLKKDTLWLFGSGRFFTVDKPIASTVVSDGTPAGIAACFADPTSCPQGVDPQHQYSGMARLTWQVSPRNKLGVYMDRIHKVRGAAMNPGYDQTTASVRWNSPLYMTNSIKWSATVSNKLLIEGGYSSNIERYNNLYAPGVEQQYGSTAWFANAAHNDSLLGTQWVAAPDESGQYPDRYNAQASASYVTGSQNIKVGFQNSWGIFNHTYRANADLRQTYHLGAPYTVTVLDTPVWSAERLNRNLGIYGQDIWTINRLTVTAGVRWEDVLESVVGQPAANGRFASVAAYGDFSVPEWKTWSPRTAVVYDLFGNGQTALRFGYNRYQAAATTTFASLYNPSALITKSLSWTDLNGDDIAQGAPGCTYLTAGCEINFSTLPTDFGVRSLSSPDPGIKRPYVDQYNVGVTHQVLPGVAVSAEWFHDISANIMERNNVLQPGTYANGTVTNASYQAVTVFSPIDGTPVTMYDPVSAAVARAVQQVDTTDTSLTQHYDDFEFNVDARLAHGVRIFGGSATDRTVANTCSSAATNPNFLISIGGVNYCDQSLSSIPWRTQFKLGATVPLPWGGVIVSGSYQGLPGYLLGTQALTAGGAGSPNFTAMSGLGSYWSINGKTKYSVCPGNSAAQGCQVGALVAPGLVSSSLSVPLIPPGTEQTPRINQVDFSIAKRVTIGSVKIDPKVDIFNLFNSSAYYSVRSTSFSATSSAGVSGGSYLYPGSILNGRLLRIGAVVTW